MERPVTLEGKNFCCEGIRWEGDNVFPVMEFLHAMPGASIARRESGNDEIALLTASGRQVARLRDWIVRTPCGAAWVIPEPLAVELFRLESPGMLPKSF